MLKKYSQEDYIGEYIIAKTSIHQGKKVEVREWIDPTFTNTKHNSVAHVIGNGISRDGFKLDKLAEVHGGLLAKEMGQTYGCNALYRDFSPDFLILASQIMADEFAEDFPNDKTIAVSWSKNLLRHPGKYHLMPYNIKLCAGASAAYLACFHGHKKIYLLGFDNQTHGDMNNNLYAGTDGYDGVEKLAPDHVYIKDLNDVMKTYDDVEFVRVASSVRAQVPELWKWRENFRQINHRNYISEADLGVTLHYLKN